MLLFNMLTLVLPMLCEGCGLVVHALLFSFTGTFQALRKSSLTYSLLGL